MLHWATPPVRLGLSGGNSGKIPEFPPETLSERFLEFPLRVRLGCPKPCNSRHLKAPEHFQNSLPPSTAGDASFFRSGSGECLSEPVMEFPAVLRVWHAPQRHEDADASLGGRFGPQKKYLAPPPFPRGIPSAPFPIPRLLLETPPPLSIFIKPALPPDHLLERLLPSHAPEQKK